MPDTRSARTAREPLSTQHAAARVDAIAGEARGTTTVLCAFLDNHSVPDSVAVSLLLRSRQLLREASEHLSAAVVRLEDA